MVIDSEREETKAFLIKTFSSDLIRFYYGTDLLGNEVGAAAKNVIGIAAGMLDGLNKTALKGALMSRGTREIARLIRAMGGNEITAYGLSHLGDYEATVFSEFSHNRKFGESFVRGEAYGELAEGVATTTALLKLGAQYGVELPICKAVDEVVNGGREPNRVLGDLFLRSLKKEF
jgi:glycerol-3-phosphate dehydrogenase (NAD(P)+)